MEGRSGISGFRLPEITFLLAINSIGKMLALGHEMSAHCRNPGCGQHSRVNLVALGRRLGFEHSCAEKDLQPHFFCQKCGDAGRDDERVGFIHHTMTLPFSAWPRERELARRRHG
ncbi:hypothetical protein RFM26_21085 [Mesorhizobium sp. VK23B]|uniref:Uncharacterized protein n=1 Tax=Mesorhizobium dulcispinae TaxID=3072316 RepID=A0ABU4XIE3_9HYPH|nr:MULTISPECIES: hypothetical protein [unclassified Mesorhizobium]MDX8468197.1 hypothetical protein [Mesorhizobium sp. VK23B]MDX8474535.1 hypothetical protein [Mesorhizobium sp. VK23A]